MTRRTISAKPNPELIDRENPELTAEDFAQARPAQEVFAELGVPMPRRRGPSTKPHKIAVSIRLSPDVLAAFRATGRGWQPRVDAALKEWLNTQGSIRVKVEKIG